MHQNRGIFFMDYFHTFNLKVFDRMPTLGNALLEVIFPGLASFRADVTCTSMLSIMSQGFLFTRKKIRETVKDISRLGKQLGVGFTCKVFTHSLYRFGTGTDISSLALEYLQAVLSTIVVDTDLR